MFGLSTISCSPEAVSYGIDCSCSFIIPAKHIDTTPNLIVPDFLAIGGFVSILGYPGDLDVKLTAYSQNDYLGCLNLKFTMKRAI